MGCVPTENFVTGGCQSQEKTVLSLSLCRGGFTKAKETLLCGGPIDAPEQIPLGGLHALRHFPCGSLTVIPVHGWRT